MIREDTATHRESPNDQKRNPGLWLLTTNQLIFGFSQELKYLSQLSVQSQYVRYQESIVTLEKSPINVSLCRQKTFKKQSATKEFVSNLLAYMLTKQSKPFSEGKCLKNYGRDD